MDSFFIKLLLDEIKGRVKKSTFIVSIIGVGILMFDISASLLVPLFQRAWIGLTLIAVFMAAAGILKRISAKKGRTKPPGTVLRSNLPYSGRRAYPFYQHLPQTSPAPVARDHIKKYFLQRHTTGGWAP